MMMMMIIIIIIITRADDSRGSKAFIGVCLCVSVCPHDNSKNEWFQSVQTWCREWTWDTLQLVWFWGWKVKVTRSQSIKTYWRQSSGRPAWAMHSIEFPASSYDYDYYDYYFIKASWYKPSRHEDIRKEMKTTNCNRLAGCERALEWDRISTL